MERPKPGNDEDELLRCQEEFLASKAKQSTSVIKKSEKRKSVEPLRDVVHMDTLPPAPPLHQPQPRKKSRFQAERDRKQMTDSRQTTGSATNAAVPHLDPEEELDRQDKGLAAILCSIIERDTSNAAFPGPQLTAQGFPPVLKNNTSTMGDGSQRQSLFAQQMVQRGVQDVGVTAQGEVNNMEISDSTCFSTFTSLNTAVQQGPLKSSIVDGHGLSVSRAEEEAQNIHKENLTKLSEMSEEEILAEQQQLLQILDPSMVEFLKSKSKSGKMLADQSGPKAHEKSTKRLQQNQPAQSKDASEMQEVISMEGQKGWLHMDKVEYDKLQWMKDLPPPSADDKKTSQQARFDFQGNVIPAKADIPVHIGLHHHGEEPERAGYSIAELFQLARSTNIQQRVVALTILGHIIHKAKEGSLDDVIQKPIIPSILEAGVIFLLRWACDDTVDAVVAAAIYALCALLCSPADEAALDWVYPWYQGNSVPALVPRATLEQMRNNTGEEDKEDSMEESDADTAKRDLIQVLMSRMMLQERLFYILDKRRPQAPTVVHIFSILTRVARHGPQMAYEIARNTKLMTLVFHNFVPQSWGAQASTQKAVPSVYGRPLPAAVRFIGSLCQTGRHVASILDSTFSLHNILAGYLSVSSNEILLSSKEADSLQKESFITWRILLSYGLAAHVFLDMYEPVMDQLREMMSRLADLSSCQPAERDVLFVSALEGIIPVAAIPPVKPGFSCSDASCTQTAVTSTVSWRYVEGLCPLVKLCCEQCLTHLALNYTQQKPSLQFPAACLNFMATFYSKCQEQASQCTVDIVQQVEQFGLNSLTPFLMSWGFTSIVANLCASSNVLSSESARRREVVSCLPELGCDANHERLVPVVKKSSPVGFLLSLCRLVFSLCRVHRDTSEQIAAVILSHKDVANYLRKVTTCAANSLHNNHFTGMETLLQFFLIKLSTLLSASLRPPMMHLLTLDVMSRLQEGDEFLAQDLMTTVLFNADFIPEGQEEELATASMANLKISRTEILKSRTEEEVTISNCQLLGKSFTSLPVIRGHYFKAFSHLEGKVAESRNRYQQLPQDTVSLMRGVWESSLMPTDWVFLPLVDLYNRFVSVKSKLKKMVESSSIPMVTSTVQWIFLLESWRNRALSHVSVTLKISRLMCIFMGGDQLFLETSVYPYLASLFRIYTTPSLLNTMNFEENIPGISFYDLYMALLEQYEAVSYGDPVFGAFVLLPMQQSQGCLMRRAVWQEKSLLLRAMTVPVQEMLIDVDRFLSPEETDTHLLQLYASSLLSGTVRQCWSPLLFLVAVHHLNRFLFYMPDDVHRGFWNFLWDLVLKCPDKNLREVILHYKQVNSQTTECMEMYTQLPAIRQVVFSQHKDRLGLP